MNQWRILCECQLRIHDSHEWVVVDNDELARIFGELSCLGNYGNDRFTGIPDDGSREHRLTRR